MLLNYETVLVGERCILVPYRNEHVVRYHEWMQDPQLLTATGSEPLSLESEYEMQASWRDDDQKCTFIVLDRQRADLNNWINDKGSGNIGMIPSDFISDSLPAMVGDVNLFFSEYEDDEDDVDQTYTNKNPSSNLQAEVDIMIADADSRGKGIGREAVLLMICYARRHLPIVRFFCKINADNKASRNLFERNLKFRECDYAECFQQYEYELKQTSSDGCDAFHALQEQVSHMEVFSCPVSSASTGPTSIMSS